MDRGEARALQERYALLHRRHFLDYAATSALSFASQDDTTVAHGMTGVTKAPLAHRLAAEAAGSAFLVAGGAGAAANAARLAPDYPALSLVTGALAIAAALVAATLTLGRVSGAYLNPALALAAACLNRLTWREAAFYCAVQVPGAILGLGIVSFLVSDVAWPAAPILHDLELRRVELVTALGLNVVAIHLAAREETRAWASGTYVFTAGCALQSVFYGNPALALAALTVPHVESAAAYTVLSVVASQIAGALVTAGIVAAFAPRRPRLVEEQRREPEVIPRGRIHANVTRL